MAKTDNKRLYILLGILGVLFIYLVLSNTVLAKKDKAPAPINNAEKKITYGANEQVPDIKNNTKKNVKKIFKYPNYNVKGFQFYGDWQSDPFYYVDEDSLRAIRDRELGQYTDLRLSGISLLQDKGYSGFKNHSDSSGMGGCHIASSTSLKAFPVRNSGCQHDTGIYHRHLACLCQDRIF